MKRGRRLGKTLLDEYPGTIAFASVVIRFGTPIAVMPAHFRGIVTVIDALKRPACTVARFLPQTMSRIDGDQNRTMSRQRT